MSSPVLTLTRRAFAVRAALGLAAAAAGTRFALGQQRGTAATARLVTYAALVEAVGHATRSQVDPQRTAYAVESLRQRFTREHPPARAAIGDVLDRVEAAPRGPTPFSRLPLKQRIEVLRSLDGNLAARAVALAAAPFHPPADEYHPTPVVL